MNSPTNAVRFVATDRVIPALAFLPLLLGILLTGCDSSSPTAEEKPTLVSWLKDNAHSIQISPSATDFSDLAGFREAIGSSRIVFLGEQSHGDGTVFLTKTRLIKFLHQEMGFDVLAFESGLFSLEKVWNLIEEGEPAAVAMPKGIFSIWMGSAQLEPLVEYVEQEARSDTPLQLVGVDCQFTGSASTDGFVDSLTHFLASNGSAQVDLPEFADFSSQLQTLVSPGWYTEKPSETEKQAFDSFLAGLREEVGSFPSTTDTGFWRQMLKSTERQAEAAFSFVAGEWDNERNSIRDEQMADNFLWLLEARLSGRKAIVWAATLHAIRDLSGIQMTSTGAYMHSGWISMGQAVWEAVGSDAYVVGFTAGSGKFGNWWSGPRVLDPPTPGTLEDVFMKTGFDNFFLNLREIDRGGESLQARLKSRPLGYVYATARWPHHMDGLIFNRTMEPSTPLGQPPA